MDRTIFLYAYMNICESLPLYLIALRYKWAYPPIWVYLIMLLPLGLFSIDIIVNDQIILLNYSLVYLFLWIARITFYLTISYIYFRGKLVVPTLRAIRAKRLWTISTFLFASGMILFAIEPFLGIQQNNSDLYAPALITLIGIVMEPSFLLLIFLHIFYPEAILLSDVQTRKAKKIYNEIHTTSQSSNIISNIGFNILKSYLDELPSEIKEKINH